MMMVVGQCPGAVCPGFAEECPACVCAEQRGHSDYFFCFVDRLLRSTVFSIQSKM